MEPLDLNRLTKREQDTIRIACDYMSGERVAEINELLENTDIDSLDDILNNGNEKYYNHEAMDRAYISQQNFESYLLKHPVILKNDNCWRLAVLIDTLLLELYQEIGRIEC